MCKTVKYRIFLLLSLVLFTNLANSQSYNTEVAGKINMEQNADLIKITGSAYNKTQFSKSLRYVMSVIKNDSVDSNSSKNDQSSRFVLDPAQKTNLSVTTINANDKNRIIILLLIYDEKDKLLGMDRVVLNGTKEDEAQEEIQKNERKEALDISPDTDNKAEDGIVLRGIVAEDTKTKPGSDFYKMFYSLYAANNINGDEIVTIKEVLAINNNTKIEIYVANEKVLEFFVRPQEQYLKSMSEIAIKRVYIFLLKHKRDKNVKRYY